MDDIYKKYALPVLQFKLENNPAALQFSSSMQKNSFIRKKVIYSQDIQEHFIF